MSITAANSIITLAVDSVFPAPVQLQGFAADDVFDIETIETTETLMGVDGFLSGGFVFVPIKWNIALQADSLSNFLFDAWFSAQTAARDTFTANGEVVLPTLHVSFILTNGYLTTYKPAPDGKKLLQPRKYGITWNTIQPIPI